MPRPVLRLLTSPLTPEYRWNPRAGRYHEGRYIDASGRLVSQTQVRASLDRTLQASGQRVEVLAQDLRSGKVTLAEWQRQMAQEMKLAHTASVAAAKGGWAQLGPAEYGRIGGRLREQYAYLRDFAKQIASGQQRLDGTLARRAQMYIQAARGSYHAQERADRQAQGFDQEHNVLGIAEHCGSCLGETARGWVLIGALIPIGSRDCLAHCKCRLQYRNSATGAEV